MCGMGCVCVCGLLSPSTPRWLNWDEDDQDDDGDGGGGDDGGGGGGDGLMPLTAVFRPPGIMRSRSSCQP